VVRRSGAGVGGTLCLAQLACVMGAGLSVPSQNSLLSPPEFVIPPSPSPHAKDSVCSLFSVLPSRHSLTTSLNSRTIRIPAEAAWPGDAANLRLLHLRAPCLDIRIVCFVACFSAFFFWYWATRGQGDDAIPLFLLQCQNYL